MLNIPKVEVHISHIFSREAFRHTSVISPACDVMISGAGTLGYSLAVQYLRTLNCEF
jgi:3-dehydroquinate dehydratase-2